VCSSDLVDLALLDVTAATLANQATNYLVGGVNPTRLGNAHPNIVPYQTFATADGDIILAVGNDGQFQRFCAFAGVPELAEDERFRGNGERLRHRAELTALLTPVVAAQPSRYWIEGLLDIPCQVEVASEFRYRKSVVPKNTLFVTLSQSGETADTLSALRSLKSRNYCGSLSICNAPESSLVRESNLVMMTRAGPEIGVASTKAFTTQLVAMLMLVASLGNKQQRLDEETIAGIVGELNVLPGLVDKLLQLDSQIEVIAEDFVDKQHALFLGRGEHHPIAMEGALKLKEISYIHAEAYPAGELKHGPLALVDAEMPVVVVAPNDELLEKLHSNMQEVKARGGKLYVFAHRGAHLDADSEDVVIEMDCDTKWVTPILSTIPLQLFSYHVAVLRGTDVDQPRNLAKSVTVE
jgi:glucosamine--fructose-6-phosphate aminotransferase (isomerizing)